MEMWRAFIAIDLPDAVRATMVQARARFEALKLDATWIKPGNMHLTLRFLGDIEPRQAEMVSQALAPVVAAAPAFTCNLGGAGVFPHPGHPRVLWIGLLEPGGHLRRLHERIEAALTDLGFPGGERREFAPHLTLARLKSARGKDGLRVAVENFRLSAAPPVVVTAVKLCRSRLTPNGSVYTVLREWTLRAAPDAG